MLQSFARPDPRVQYQFPIDATDPHMDAGLAPDIAPQTHDLGFGETAYLHRNRHVYLAEKKLRPHPLRQRG